MYIERSIDRYLEEWAKKDVRKPMLLRGARQVGKSTAVRYLGSKFKNFVEINFERQPEYKAVFADNLVPERIISQIAEKERYGKSPYAPSMPCLDFGNFCNSLG